MCQYWLSAVVCLLYCGVTSADPIVGQLYWSNRKKIQTAKIDGTGITDLVTGLNTAADVEIDLVNQHVYWTDIGNHTIQRASLDGTNVETLVGYTGTTPIGLELDIAGGHMYWTDRTNRTIARSELDGSNQQIILDENVLDSIYHFDLDLTNHQVYWTTGSSREVMRANLDGTNVQTIATVTGDTNAIVLDIQRNRLFWTEGFLRRLWESELDGTNATPIFELESYAHFLDMELDPISQQLYISDNYGTRVWSIGADGSNAFPVVGLDDTPPANLLGLAVIPVPEPSTLWLMLIGAVLVLRRCSPRHK